MPKWYGLQGLIIIIIIIMAQPMSPNSTNALVCLGPRIILVCLQQRQVTSTTNIHADAHANTYLWNVKAQTAVHMQVQLASYNKLLSNTYL
jgi:hypothetical protein